MDQMRLGHFNYKLPPRCVDLDPGVKVSDPLETARAGQPAHENVYVLIRLADGRRLWTLASWIVTDSDRSFLSRPSSPAEAESQKTGLGILASLRRLEKQGRAMESLRHTQDLQVIRQCGDAMRTHQNELNGLAARAGTLPNRYGMYLRASAFELDPCVSCVEDAAKDCDRAHETIQSAALALGVE
jgi:hypothetical protein